MTSQYPDTAPDDASEATDPAAVFARELRLLRESAGSPSFRELARRAHFSVSTVAEATAGRRLPSESVVRAFASACDADPDEWAQRLHKSAQALSEPSGGPDQTPATAAVPRPRPRLSRWGAEAVGGIVLAAAGLAVGVVLGHTRTPATPTHPAVVAAAITYPANDGDNPITAGCLTDAQLLDKASLMRDSVQVGALELKYSARCHAGWARVYLYPAGVAAGLAGPTGPVATVTVSAADGTASSYAQTLVKQQPDFTDAITPHGGCLKASASLAVQGAAPISAEISCDSPPAPTVTVSPSPSKNGGNS